jgi:hypothetical protein
LKRMPGSVALYAPGNATRLPVLMPPLPPEMLSCAHEMYSCAPLGADALCSAMCSTRRRYSPFWMHWGMRTETWDLPGKA